MSGLDHPVVQSLVLPVVLTLLAIALLPRVTGRAADGGSGAFGPALALLVAFTQLPGIDWPARAAAQKLPWIVGAALLLGVAVHALQRRAAAGGRAGAPAWAATSALWAAASIWLVPAMPSTRTLAWFAAVAIGAARLAALVWPGGRAAAPAARRVAPSLLGASTAPAGGAACAALPAGGAACAALGVAAGALALLGATGGSMLLGQLAGMVASVTGVAAAWALWRPAWPVPAAALTPLGVALLSVALALAGRVAWLPLALLALAAAAPLLVARWRGAARRPRVAIVASGLLAALPAAAALPVALTGAPAGTVGVGAGADDRPAAPSDDPYYAPR